ncbi:hypothetical protein [Streptomyces buecherae]|uniref:Uncharacterized protein n=1 Tax=Streptomyces buecherae TaxID=2763006 RepID=A0A7H8NGJ3_9ACTN|nr:hypothetical protein [Streptomyces buecherae]QKW53619.1 hypothetical protein HUT08_33310 [Streptomyces buecherae]
MKPSEPAKSGTFASSVVRRRVLLGTTVLAILVTIAGLAAYLTRGDRTPQEAGTAKSAATSPTSPTPTASTPNRRAGVLPTPPKTHDPIAFAKAAAAALWSYDTRASSQPELLRAMRTWLTRESKYADAASVEALVPTPALWKQMGANGQFATATVHEGHFPASFTRALQTDPGAITDAYLYAVTVSGKQSIAWKGSPAGGAESRATTLAVQCRPSRPCALAGVLPAVAP